MIEEKSLDVEKTVLVGIINSRQDIQQSKEYLDELEDNEVDVESFRINLGKVWESYSTLNDDTK